MNVVAFPTEKRTRSTAALVVGTIAVAALSMSNAALAQNVRGSAEGPTKARGYDHPEQYMTSRM